jgi:hypothetical protein
MRFKMKNKKTVLLLVLLITLFAFSTTACDSGKRLNSADELKAYLDSLPVNSPDKPIKVAIKANDAMLKDIKEVLLNTDKYVSLDLSGSPLTKIPDNAFYYSDDYEGDEEEEFYYEVCETLVGIIIPKGVTRIGARAFLNCTRLTSVTIPNSVTSIGGGAFQNCESLKSVTIPKGVTSIDGVTFYYCSNLTNITIPDSVTSIGEMTFYNCSNLTNITIPKSVTRIGERAFESCTSLKSITIPNSVTSIGSMAFYCEALTSVTFQGTIASNMFGTNYGGSFSRPFYRGLSDKYLAEGIGTYTTTAPVDRNSTWTKQ